MTLSGIVVKINILLSFSFSSTSFMLIAWLLSPTLTSLVEAASNKHTMSPAHCASACCLVALSTHTMSSTNMGTKLAFWKVDTFSFGP